jgi:hypothetical protein
LILRILSSPAPDPVVATVVLLPELELLFSYFDSSVLVLLVFEELLVLGTSLGRVDL